MFFAEKYRDPIDRNYLSWLGKEVEYRSCHPLTFSRQVFRGRIIKVCPHEYFIVEAHYVSSFSVKEYPRKKRPYKKSYLKKSPKNPWKEMKSELHLVKLVGRNKSRWKMIKFQ